MTFKHRTWLMLAVAALAVAGLAPVAQGDTGEEAAWALQHRAGRPWQVTGNAGTDPAVNFVGTTDDQPLVLAADGTQGMRVQPHGGVLVATSTPDFTRGGGELFKVSDSADHVAAYVDSEDPAGSASFTVNIVDPAESGVFKQGNALQAVVYGTDPTVFPAGHTVAGTPVSDSAFVFGQRGNSGSLEHMAIVAGTGADLRFATDLTQQMIIDTDGNVGVGTIAPVDKLEVSGGNIRVTGGSFIDDGVTLTVPDYVFDSGYPLMSLEEVERFVDTYGHLPDVPSADQIAADGLNLSEFQMVLLQKIEELTLYALQQQAEIDALRAALAGSG